MTKTITAVAAACAILVSAFPVEAQQKAPLIGFLTAGTKLALASRFTAFREKMLALGYVEGHTIRYAYRYGVGKNQRLAGLASELVRLEPKVIVTHGTPATSAAQKATRTIPIVMSGGDPVRSGLVKSLVRPGGNITGQTVYAGREFWGKRLALLKESAPATALVGLLYAPSNSSHHRSLRVALASAAKIGVTILPLPVEEPEDVKGAFDVIKRERADAFFYLGSPIISSRMKEMIAFALKNRLPFMSIRAVYVRQGALFAYSVNFQNMFGRKAIQADKIMKGANPAEMPIQRPTKYDLTVNMKTAKAISVTFPPSILLRVTEVIE